MIGIRREDKNEWERRAPLTPEQVARLRESEGLQISVQPSSRRVFDDEAYRRGGARVDESLDDCGLVLGIKEIPVAQLQAGKTYVYFSHTTKGQPHNMPMLRRLMELGCTLIDYEQVADEHDRRLIFFGRHAGHAGMIDGLWAFGRRLAAEGHDTPLAGIRPAHAYASLDEAKRHLAEVGEALHRVGLPAGVPPLVCGITGTGNVSSGAWEVFDCLGAESIPPDELETAARSRRLARNVAYRTVFDLDQRFVRRDGGAVTIEELSSHPERFANGILRYLPHISLLVNGMFWVPALPRLLTRDDLQRLWRSGELRDLKVVADVSCDIDGAIEATVKATTPDAPVYVFVAETQEIRDGFDGAGPVILAVDNLPAELPREASHDFGEALLPFVPRMARCRWNAPLDELDLPPELARAIIVHRGELTPRFAYLQRHLDS